MLGTTQNKLLRFGLVITLATAVVPLRAAQRPNSQQREIAQENLLDAIHRNNIDKVADALQAGADINEISQDMAYTPLKHAVSAEYSNNLPLVEFLLSHGAQETINTPDGFGQTPLLTATIHKSKPLVELLLAHGAQRSINAPDELGRTPLLVAAHNGQLSLVELLLIHGGSFSTETLTGKYSPEKITELNSFVGGITSGDNKFLKKKFTPEIYTLLCIVGVIKTTPKELSAIVRNLSVEERARALHVMQSRIMQTRLELHHKQLTLEDIQLLAALGDEKSQSMIAQLNQEFVEQKNIPKELAAMLMEYENPLHQEKEEEDKYAQAQSNALNAFMIACSTGKAVKVDSMIGKIDINAHAPNFNNMTPLILASARGRIHIVQLLLNSGAEITATDDGGNTALGMAIRNGHEDVVRALCAYAQQHDQMDALSTATNIRAALKKTKPDKRAQMEKVVGQYVNLTEDES